MYEACTYIRQTLNSNRFRCRVSDWISQLSQAITFLKVNYRYLRVLQGLPYPVPGAWCPAPSTQPSGVYGYKEFKQE